MSKVVLEMEDKIQELVKMMPIAYVTVDNRKTKNELVQALNETNIVYKTKKKAGIWTFTYISRSTAVGNRNDKSK